MKHTQFFSLIISFLIATFFFHPHQTLANQEHLRIITFLNQVRGGECCDPGSVENLQTQINTFNQNKITATFAVRYDAIQNKGFIKLLIGSNHEIAGLLEITPSLAQKAQVDYYGNEEDWYLAKHAFLVGYSPEERIKLINTYMEEFENTFGFFPTTTSAWQIDSTSLNYLQEKYNVTTHQITRNQWGTDSYTMYGGPIHYPYYASENWPFMPGNSPVFIIRQTVVDPLRNYADHTASHTSQPNDYMQNKDFSYFDKLLTQTLNQTHNSYSFAILGLENSMDQRFQQEYIKQIEWVKNFVNENPDTYIVSAKDISSFDVFQKLLITHGENLTSEENQEAIYITTPNYQARIYREDQRVTITDFRIYSPKISTYTKDQAGHTPTNYWIAPFLVDSSRTHLGKVEKSSKTLSLRGILTTWQSTLKKILEPNLPDFPIYNPSPDHKTNFVGISLPDIKSNTRISINSEKITYQGPDNQEVVINAGKDFIKLNRPNIIKLNTSLDKNNPFENFPQIQFENNSLTWDGFFQLKFDVVKNESFIIPTILAEDIDVSTLSSTTYFPGLQNTKASSNNSFLIAHNPIAIAGQNPIRIFTYTIDENQIPTHQDVSITSSAKKDQISIHPPPNLTGSSWADIESQDFGKRTITAYIDEDQFDQINVFFVPNCKSSPINCLKHPELMLRYIQLQINTKALQIINRF